MEFVEKKEKVVEEAIFAQGFCGLKLFWIFVIGSVFGTYYEQILTAVMAYFKYGSFVWELRRGVLYGPFSPIYGAGAVLMILLLGRNKRPAWKIFLYGALLGGGFEYLISVLQEIFVGSISWDYSGQFLSIGGRTTVRLMMIWGLMCYIFVEKIYPYLSAGIEKIPYHLGMIVSKIFIIFLCVDMLISWTALFRQSMRKQNIPPYTPIGKLYDTIYPDSVLEYHFPNMQIKVGN